MREGKQLILATKPYAIENTFISSMATLSTWALLIITFLGAFLIENIWIRSILSLLEALLIVRMFVIYHDYLHKTILQNSIWANILFSLFGYIILTPKSIWRRSHDYHHAHNSKLFTSSIGSFPIVTTEKYNQLTSQERAKYLFIRHPLTIAFGYIFAFAWGITLRSLLANPVKHWDSAVALFVHYGLIIFFILNFGWATAMFSLFIPIFIAHAIGSYLFYAQHNFPTATFEEKEGWTYIGAALNSSSFLKMNKLMHWFTANIGYHHIHHANARIPFYRLPEVFKAFPEFQHPKFTSLNPVDIFKCLQLKVWDPNMQRMLTLSEIRDGS